MKFFQSTSSHLLTLTLYCLVFFLLPTKQDKLERGARLSTTQIYNTQCSLIMEVKCLEIEAMYAVDQLVVNLISNLN